MLNPLFLSFLLVMIHAQPRFQRDVIDDNLKIGYGVDTGDVDGDGLPDILLADKEQFAWYRNPDWERFVMVDKLTEKDNVCLAARDIDGDGMVEVAVGARWNPGETTNAEISGSVHYLVRPADPTDRWKPVELHHEPTVHRMHWIRTGNNFQLVVLPLHGRGNVDGEGAGVRILAYDPPDNPEDPWAITLLDETLHMTHNFDVINDNGQESLLVGGKEGAKIIRYEEGKWLKSEWIIRDYGFGEIRHHDGLIAGIQPMHGNLLAIYSTKDLDSRGPHRILLSDKLQQGHALALADLLSLGKEQVIAGWREKNEHREMGIKIYMPDGSGLSGWREVWIDRNGIACEDLKIADLNLDGKIDIIASGRSTHNLVIYWNRSQRVSD